ncbi:hypothetical protein NQZ79_g6824 [Umbelopsis isabellina]|nr:hypothetical protein NQZ79_g6824 [Umbelopsis isabellina]
MPTVLPSIGYIPKPVAAVVCVGFTLIYLAGFYVFVNIRTGKTGLSRNDPKVILARFKAVTVSSITAATVVWLLLNRYGAWEENTIGLDQIHSLLSILGVLTPSSIAATINVLVLPLLLTASLFLGPLSILYMEQCLIFQYHFDFKRDVLQTVSSLEGLRNYIVGPLTEEFVFRACVIAVLKFSGYSTNYLIFASSLYFGLAHLHHAWETYHSYGANAKALKTALLQSGFQFVYTTVFGWYVSWIFIRTDSVWAPTICHTFCNIMGFPDIGAISSFRPRTQKGKAVILIVQTKYILNNSINPVLWSLFFVGIIMFALLMNPLTSPKLYDSSIYM